MSYKSFEKALDSASKCNFYTIKGKRSKEVVARAEELFGHKFSRQNYDFYIKLGYLSFWGNEFYGIGKDDFSGTYTGCAIEATLQDRKEYNLPREWLIIYDFGDGYMGYLDYSQVNKDGEPPVIMAIYDGKEYIVIEKVAEDFGDFLLKLVEEQMIRQKIN